MMALSIVAPHGSNIATGRKTLEVRSWQPDNLPVLNLLIVENSLFLSSKNETDPNGIAIAIVDIHEVHPWLPSEIEAACSAGWLPNYWAWQISNVRRIISNHKVIARRKIYKAELNEIDVQFE